MMTTESGNNSLEQVLQKDKQGAIIMMELPADTYFEANSDAIKLLINNGFDLGL